MARRLKELFTKISVPVKQTTAKTIESIAKPANTIVSTIQTTSRITKWSVILISGGVFLFGLSKTIDSVNNAFIKPNRDNISNRHN